MKGIPWCDCTWNPVAEARRRIVQLVGDVPRIELFARDRVSGWDAWGNEVVEECA